MANVFNSVDGLHPRRNAFSALTYRNDFTAPLGVNIPVYLQEVTPATRVKLSVSALVRLQALIAPVMDNIDYYVHFWKIPYRLLENDRFTQFISGEISPDEYDSLFCTAEELSEAVISVINGLSDPHINTGPKRIALYKNIFYNGSIMDFLGYDKSIFADAGDDDQGYLVVDTEGNDTTSLNWRGLFAYFMIHLNWYMNENVPYFENFPDIVDTLVKQQDLQSLSKLLVYTALKNSYYNSDNGNITFYSSMLPHAWGKDYFTSALPNVQYGEPVTLPLGGTAPVSLNSEVDHFSVYGQAALSDLNGLSIVPGGGIGIDNLGALGSRLGYVTFDPDGGDASIQKVTSLIGNIEVDPTTINSYNSGDELVNPYVADLSEASAITINELRFANALQVFKERQMRFGRRRLEYYKGFFDVSPEDLRLQVPKYLGGGRMPINISDIEQTSATSGSQALGRLAGKATGVAGGFAGFTTFCSEETVLIGIAFAMPHQTYANSLSRFKMKTNDPYDYFNPSFEHLGEQAIKNIEVFAGSQDPDGDFGYTPRYNEYRFHGNEMHGEFKGSLSYWTLGRIFSDTPALNADFIYMQPRVFDRIFAVAGQPNIVASMMFNVKAIQPISKYGTPMLLA